MATYLFKDANKAAFVNGVNNLFKDNGLDREISSTDLLDAMPGKAEFTFYITDDPQEDDILKNAEKTKYFTFPFRAIDLQEMIRESKKLQPKKKSKK
jgi:hypothetical protein